MKLKKAHNRIEMIGKTYNSWRVLEHIETVNKIAFYKCLCLECNTKHKVRGPNIRQGLSKRCIKCGNREGHDKQKGTSRVKDPKVSAVKAYFNRYKKTAKRKNLEFSLTFEEFAKLTGEDCTYCGEPPVLKKTLLNGSKYSKLTEELSAVNAGGIDRIDSDKGYIKENCAPCCSRCNYAKRDMTVEEFKKWALQLAAHFMLGK